jgi:hypothetical protein
VAWGSEVSGRWARSVVLAVPLLTFAGAAFQAAANGPNLITNGSFETTTLSVPANGGYICTNGPGIRGTCTSAITGWSANGDNGGDAFTQNFVSQTRWNDSGNISANGGTSKTAWVVAPGHETGSTGFNTFGFTSAPGASPDGGNYIALDGDQGNPVGTNNTSYSSSIWQTISGLTPGAQYSLQFYQAAAQQSGTTGATTEQWAVSFGAGPEQMSTLMNNASGGHVAWEQQTMIFTATLATQTLNFFSVGTPSGQPPVVLLDGVTLRQVPEPASLVVLGGGLLVLLADRYRRARRTGLGAPAIPSVA